MQTDLKVKKDQGFAALPGGEGVVEIVQLALKNPGCAAATRRERVGGWNGILGFIRF